MVGVTRESVRRALAGAPSWGGTGLSDTSSYTTSITPMFSLSPTWNFSSTANAWSAISLSPTVVPTGASAGNGQGVIVGTTLGTSAVNAGDVRGLTATLTLSAGYTGTATTIIGLQAQVNNSGAAQATARAVYANYPGNGNGISSGSVNNAAISTGSGVNGAISAAAGGTVTNTGVRVEMNAGSGAGTTTNYGIHITGNGGSGGGGTTTNRAIHSDSTAESLLSGALTMAVDRALKFTSQTSGSGAQTGTLSNAPTAGNPGHWLKVVIGGVNYAIPAWAG
jgi:hypothetical protein